ncbi:phage upper tail fiber protein [Nocardia cyriacigeorgica]|uniref:phage upper tail fiber protein n=1 Tax=Nocardia cyriacigeorgica TaxID=135487 RepID=UPI0024547319|nr:hypothetical protein [Nocardia cyriacigeorgica]
MTIISEHVSGVAGADEKTVFEFWAPVLRESSSGTGLLTTRPHHLQPVDGILTTPELDPGPAHVRIGHREYRIEVPDSPTPVRLWPLIEAGLPVPPTEEATAVRNGGGVARIQRISQAEYDALVTPDPETLYVVP